MLVLGQLKGDVLAWFEPVLCGFVENENDTCEKRTVRIVLSAALVVDLAGSDGSKGDSLGSSGPRDNLVTTRTHRAHGRAPLIRSTSPRVARSQPAGLFFFFSLQLRIFVYSAQSIALSCIVAQP